MINTPRLILASESPRRADLLREAGFSFEVLPAQIDESPLPAETPGEMTLRLARAKATAVTLAAAPIATKSPGQIYVLGADTAVAIGNELFGKPSAHADAARMIRALSGRTHTVVTGIWVIRLPDQANRAAIESTSVTFGELSDDEIEAYVATGEPFGKAGGYAIQGRASRFIPRVEGSYPNVVGLPIARVWTLLRELGWQDSPESRNA
jgi:septum formation protein